MMYSLTCSWGQEPGAQEARKEISKISFCLVVFILFSSSLYLFTYQFTLIFTHGCYVTSMSVGGNRMALDHSFTHSLDSDQFIH